MTAHKIAIIKVQDKYYNDDYDSYHSYIAQSITEWETVSHEDYRMLKAAEGRFEFRIIEQITDPAAFIPKTIADYRAILQEEEAVRLKEQKKRQDAALAKKLKKELKDKTSKLELFNKLKAELGDEAK